jgi:two-component system OmpR family sensor kinase
MPDLQPVSVPEIVNVAVDGLAPRIAEAGMQVEREISPDLPLILADPDLAVRCLGNLIENSLKYAASGRCIRLSAHAGQDGHPGVELTVEDLGPGIPDEDVNVIFEPFYRGASARRLRQPGSGLGLAIVRSGVEAQGGTVRLERAVPHGCRFRIFFPSCEPDGTIHSG